MENDFIIELAHRALKVTLMMAAPMLLSSLVVGIVISLFQAVTQINEQTLSFIPKIIVIFFAIVIASPWLSEVITTFTRELIVNIPQILVDSK
jgi:flagellar biosynthetic protein FliQ